MFRGEGAEAFHPAGYITDAGELSELAAFFFWGGWVCGAQRPGADYSYTHNWPYDELAGNRPTAPVMMWSVAAALGLIAVLGIVLFLYGRYSRLAGWRQRRRADENLAALAQSKPSIRARLQRATYKFFAAAAALFVLQIVAGVLTIHDFLRFTHVFGVDLAELLPITIVRGWHLQLALLWISACWVGASIFVLSTARREVPAGLLREVNLLFGLVRGAGRRHAGRRRSWGRRACSANTGTCSATRAGNSSSWASCGRACCWRSSCSGCASSGAGARRVARGRRVDPAEVAALRRALHLLLFLSGFVAKPRPTSSSPTSGAGR
jgi:hypothetical protein